MIFQAQAAPGPAPRSSSHALHHRVLQRKCACGGTPGPTGKCTECEKNRRSGLQTKLKVSEPGDIYEQEADRIADRVMSAPTDQAVSGAPLRIQRFVGQPSRQSDTALASVDHVIASPGRPLESAVRQDMERRMGHDFSQVRIHTGAIAEQSALEVNADAYTAGSNIVFGAGQFQPSAAIGRHLLAHELTHVVQQSLASGRMGNTRALPVAGAIQRKPRAPQVRIIRAERYWQSTTARVFFDDGSNEEVTFIQGSSLDGPAAPEGRDEKVVNVFIDRSSAIRPHLEVAADGRGSRVKVETRLSPRDRIARLPANVWQQLAESFPGAAEGEYDPTTMEFIADMGDGLHESSTSVVIPMEGRDPATLLCMQTVDHWVDEQKDVLSKIGSLNRGKFTQLLREIREVGVTGPTASDDLNAQEIELVLAGVAGGQSNFGTYAEYKRVFEWKRRRGAEQLSEDTRKNPEWFLRNEYRRAWKAEAAGLRRMSRIAEAAQFAPFIAIGGSALIGSGLFGLEVLGAAGLKAAAARGVSGKLIGTYVGTSLLATSGYSHLTTAVEEAGRAGMDPSSPLTVANVVATATLRTFGVGEVNEAITNKSILTREDLKRSPTERVVGVASGLLNAFGNASMIIPDAPPVVQPREAPAQIVKTPPAPDHPPAAAFNAAEVPPVQPTPPVAGNSALQRPVRPPARPTEEGLARTEGQGERIERLAGETKPLGAVESSAEGRVAAVGNEVAGAPGIPSEVPKLSPSAELNFPGPHPFFKKPTANENRLLTPEAQAAERPLASTGTGDVVSIQTIRPSEAPTSPLSHQGPGMTMMAGERSIGDRLRRFFRIKPKEGTTGSTPVPEPAPVRRDPSKPALEPTPEPRAILPNEKSIPPHSHSGGYHGTTLHPEEVMKSGLPEVGNNWNLQNHAEELWRFAPPEKQVNDSAFRGTTSVISDPVNESGAAYFAGEGGYVYDIQGVPTWDVNKALQGQVGGTGSFRGNLMHGEGEYAIPARVTPDRIKRWGKVKADGRGRLYVEWFEGGEQ